MTQFIWELYGWDLQSVNLQKLFSIQVQNILLSLVFFVMMRLQEISNSKNMTHFQEDSFKETNNIKDVRQCHMICTNLIQIKYYQKHHQN
jgi:hypothetical protein